MHAAAAQTGWTPNQGDFERFIQLRDREQSGQPLSTDERAFVGQWLDFAVDSIEFSSNTAKQALKKRLRDGAISDEAAAKLEVGFFKVPELRKNPGLQAALDEMVRVGSATDAQIDNIIALAKKISYEENNVLQSALGALSVAGILTDPQIDRINKWLDDNTTAREGNKQKWEFFQTLGKFGIVAAMMTVILWTTMHFAPQLENLGENGMLAARVGMGLGALGLGILVHSKFGQWIASKINNFGVND